MEEAIEEASAQAKEGLSTREDCPQGREAGTGQRLACSFCSTDTPEAFIPGLTGPPQADITQVVILSSGRTLD